MSLGSNVIKFRKQKGLVDTQLSKKSNITSGYMSEIENNKKIPTVETMQKIAKALNVTVSELLGETNEEISSELKTLLDFPKQLNDYQLSLGNNLISCLGRNQNFFYIGNSNFGGVEYYVSRFSVADRRRNIFGIDPNLFRIEENGRGNEE